MRNGKDSLYPASLVLLDKRPGRTSFDSLGTVKRALGIRRAGHTGTLDSFASGLLVIVTGALTRLAPWLTGLDKTYQAKIIFGSETDTLDPSGEVVERAPLPSENEARHAAERFTGEILQHPPRYSALKLGGKRASDLTRAGKDVELMPRLITIYDVRVESIAVRNGLSESAVITVDCSSGTYIRSLARDIGRACGSRAHTAELRRTRVGGFCVENAARADDAAWDNSWARSFSPELAEYCSMGSLVLKPEYERDFFNGKALAGKFWQETRQYGESAQAKPARSWAVFRAEGGFAGVVEENAGKFSYGFVMSGERSCG